MKNSESSSVIRVVFNKRLYSLFLLIVLLFKVQYANALGVGAANADSYIGQRLSGSIPIFNIRNPDQLQLNILSSTFSISSGPTLSAGLDRSNGQLAIRISSDLPVNEPYISFVLEIVDQTDTIKKEFILLLNLAPKGTNLASQSTPYTAAAPQAVALADKQLASGELMGPYEWAQAGNIPDRFGAVIDGQSLWRVARRINTAMGVSVNQMMLALYRQNRDAFLTNSVDSLQAGSFLTIPSLEQTASVSDAQAKRELQQLSAAQSEETTRVVQTNDAIQDVVIGADSETADSSSTAPEEASQSAEESVAATQINERTSDIRDDAELAAGDQSAGSSVDAESFRLSGLDGEDPSSGLTPLGSRDEKSQEIISSLAATVGNLTQELIQKDKKIEFLEGKIAALEELVGVDANSQTPLAISQNAVAEQEPVARSEIAKPEQSRSAWSWLWLILPVLAVLGFLLRSRIADVSRDLNLFGGKGKVDFGGVKHEEEPVLEVQKKVEDQPVFAAATDLTVNEMEHSEIDLSQPPDEETVLELEDPSILEFNESNMDFDQRFERLLDEKDFDFALELLNFARHNEIEEDRYHCERLRLLQAMNDEDAFYNYYYDIENNISSFDLSIQNRISQLVVDLAQSKAQ